MLTALAATSLLGCSSDAPAPPTALPSDVICQEGETADSCLDNVRLALQSAFVDAAGRGTITGADYERVVGSVVSPVRLDRAFSYTLLTEPRDGVDQTGPAPPTQFRVLLGTAGGTWWLCPQDGRVQEASCEQDG